MMQLLQHTDGLVMALALVRLATAGLLVTTTTVLVGIPTRLRIGGALVFAMLLLPQVDIIKGTLHQ